MSASRFSRTSLSGVLTLCALLVVAFAVPANAGGGAASANKWSNSNKTGIQNITKLNYQFKSCPKPKNAFTQYRQTSFSTKFNRSYGYRGNTATFRVQWGQVGFTCAGKPVQERKRYATKKAAFSGLSGTTYTYNAPSSWGWLSDVEAGNVKPAGNVQVGFKVSGESKKHCVVASLPGMGNGGCGAYP
jgi:hypothetical protein